MTTERRKLLTKEEIDARNSAKVTKEAEDRDAMERIVKFVYMAKNKRCPSNQLVGGLISSSVTYNGNTFNIVTNLNEDEVKAFKDDRLYAFI